METPDRQPVSPTAAVHRIDEAIVVEAQEVRAVALRRHRPIEAVAANIVQGPATEEPITGRRIPDGT